MSSVLLRKMTYKSKFDFGQYKDLTVQEVFNQNKTRYLRWCYYNLDRISFIDEILTILGIVDEWVIDKPSKDPEKGQKLQEIKSDKMGFKAKNRDKKLKKIKINKADRRTNGEEGSFTKKENLRSRNQKK